VSEARQNRVRQRLDGVDALLVTNLDNIRWLTGFTGSNGWLVVGPDRATLITDGRYAAQAERQLAESGVSATVSIGMSGAQLIELVGRACAEYGRVAFEAAHLSVHQHGQYTQAIAATLVPTVGVVEAGRRNKDETEIAAIARAATIADQALASTAPQIVAGVTEAQVRNTLEVAMRELGASGPSYETIVAAGPINAALPHHRPTDTVLADGDLVIIDVGALVHGYHSDMTRTLVVGGRPNAQQTELYELVQRAQQAGLDAVCAGLPAKDLDAACRSVIAAAGYGDWFSHGTGHGVGLLIHEDPYANATSTDVLMAGDVVTVEPGVYRGGFGGIRIEDLVVVTENGCRNLTSSPKDSLCLQSPPTT